MVSSEKRQFVTLIIPRMVLRVPVERVSDEMPHGLTPMEQQIFALLAQGKRRKEIANAMNLSTHTVRFHVANVYRKSGVTDHLVFLAKYGKPSKK